MRLDEFSQDIYDHFDEYRAMAHVKSYITHLHELLLLPPEYFYRQQVPNPSKILAAAIYGLKQSTKKQYLIDKTSEIAFYKGVIITCYQYYNVSMVDLHMPNELPLRTIVGFDVVGQISRGLARQREQSLKSLCEKIGLNYREIRNNRSDTVENLLLLIEYAQSQGNQYLKLSDLLLKSLYNRLARFFRSNAYNYSLINAGLLMTKAST